MVWMVTSCGEDWRSLTGDRVTFLIKSDLGMVSIVISQSFLLVAVPHPPILFIFVGRPLSRPLPLPDFAHLDSSWLRRMSSSPVFLQPPAQVVACLFQTVFVEDDVPHFKGALGKLFSGNHLNIHVLRLRLAARLDQTLQDLWGGDLQVD